jgi:hypothetical protein
LTIIGWFFDKASNFPWLSKYISRDAYCGLKALDYLAGNVNGIIRSGCPGFREILRYWPKLSNEDSVCFIRRGPAYLKFGSQIGSGFALVTCDAETKQIGDGWEEPEARKIFRSKLDIRLFKYGGAIFYFGILLTVVSWLFELINR